MPQEKEILITDGENFYVIDVNKNHKIKNKNNESITITYIHLTRFAPLHIR